MQFYPHLLTDIRARIHQAQTRAAFAANAELIALYWDIGRLIHERQQQEGWGAGVIPRLSRDILNELSEIKGFSEQNIKFMVQFFKAYDDSPSIGKRAVSQSGCLRQVAAQIPWGHNILLMQQVKSLDTRLWYMRQTVQNGWSRDVHTPIGVTKYELTRALPANLQGSLPSIESIEAELSRSNHTSPPMSVTATHVNIYHICPRELWLHANEIRMESGSELVAEGKFIGETSYADRAEGYTEVEVDGVKIDFYDRKTGVVHEVKKSDRLEAAYVAQVKYYLYKLEQSGIAAQHGLIEYPKLRKTTRVDLTDADRAAIPLWEADIRRIVGLEVCPPVMRKPFCKHCSFYEFCYVEELED